MSPDYRKGAKSFSFRDCEDGEIAPKTHDLSRLAVHPSLFDLMSEEQQNFIEDLNPYSIEARYPPFQDEIEEGLTKESCEELIVETEAVLCWIKKQL